jgi:hypothetical protein
MSCPPEKARVSLHDGCAAQLHSPTQYSGELRSALHAIVGALPSRRFEFEPAGDAGREISSPLLELQGFNVNSVVKRIGELMPDRVNCMYECGLVAAAGVHFNRVPGCTLASRCQGPTRSMTVSLLT